MSQDLRPGTPLPIPCRVCSSVMIPFMVDWGRHLLSCPGCGQETQADVREERGVVRIRTRKHGT